jgi:hypothetical protein
VSEGVRPVLFTDGLVEGRDRDIDTGFGLLRHSLSEVRGMTPEETCQAVFDAMVTSRARDDIALVTWTGRLAGDRAAEWGDVPFDPAAVSVVRAQCGRRLQDWGLEDIGFATELIFIETELIFIELITNAILYGAPPIRVRLVHDRPLICEVSDGSSTSPHLRRAAATDQGERGLFLAAQFAERWGTRYTHRDRAIRAEQSLQGSPSQDTGGDMEQILLSQWDDEPQ